ncbi:MAG TPA: damage-inducible protein [Geminicoccaceae bacterium]|nr:damage-inducible protein [Geminicoccaceae bacterium]
MSQTAKQRLLDRLRARLARLDHPPGGRPVLPLGLAAVDQVLPGGGLARGCLHELCGAPDRAAATGFAAALLGRLAADGHAAWIGPRDDLYAPGLAAQGLPPGRLIVVRAGPRDARLWALEEALRSPGLTAALAEVDRLTLTQSRRLQLAAEAKGVTAFLLRPLAACEAPSAATTRWRITPLPAAADPDAAPRAWQPPRWQVELIRCRGGRTGAWAIAWREGGFHEITGALALAAEPGDRPDRAQNPVQKRAKSA